MNLNNWLCKHFDKEKKGYVTISDFINQSIKYILRLIVVLFISALLYAGAIFIINIKDRFSPDTKEADVLGIWGFILWVVIIDITIMYLWETKISNIRIAKCPLKEDDKK